MGWKRLWDWKVLVVGAQLAAGAVCMALGWQLLHGTQTAAAVKITAAAQATPAAAVGFPTLPSLSAGPARAGAARPGVADLLQRVNADDARLYRGQWATIQVLARGTRNYVERHILPLVLAAARGGNW